MFIASVAVVEKSVPQTIGALWFFFTSYRSSSVQEFLTRSKTSSDLFMAESTCGLSPKQIVAICGNLKALRCLENKETFATNSNVFA
jgi:hypothetical protein